MAIRLLYAKSFYEDVEEHSVTGRSLTSLHTSEMPYILRNSICHKASPEYTFILSVEGMLALSTFIINQHHSHDTSVSKNF